MKKLRDKTTVWLIAVYPLQHSDLLSPRRHTLHSSVKSGTTSSRSSQGVFRVKIQKMEKAKMKEKTKMKEEKEEEKKKKKEEEKEKIL